MVRLELKDVDLTFRINGARLTAKEIFVNHLFFRRPKPKQVQALQGINLCVEEGQRLGIVGHNGAGKSTILRLLAGIYMPTAGQRIAHGKISSMLDIGVGIEPDASGWENILFRGYLQGQTPAELKLKAPEIAAFSELGEFLEHPVRCYSSGMHVRLAFSIATAIEPEILLIDEVFSAGDAGFQKKATARMTQLMERARIIIMASHDMVTLRNFCQNVIWLDHGKIRMQGPSAVVTAAYSEYMAELSAARAA